MTVVEIQIANALQNCSFLPGTFDKKFAHQLSNWTGRTMTLKGRAMMLKMLEKYRRQIPDYLKLRGDVIKETQERLHT